MHGLWHSTHRLTGRRQTPVLPPGDQETRLLNRALAVRAMEKTGLSLTATAPAPNGASRS